MFTYTLRRLMFAVPTLFVISFIIFALLDLAPNDPTGNLPLTIPPEVREKIRLSLGLGEPLHIRYFKCCLLYTSPSPRDGLLSRMPSSA